MPKEPSVGGGVAPSPVSAAAASEPSSTAAVSKAPKRKMGMAQYLANKRRKEVEQVQSAAVTQVAASPTVSHENGEKKVPVASVIHLYSISSVNLLSERAKEARDV